MRLRMFRRLAVLGVILSVIPHSLTFIASMTTRTVAAMPTPLLLPFSMGETWYVCRGYNQGTHTNTYGDPYGLDLSIAPNSPSSGGCDPATKDASTGKTVVAPGAGTVFQGNEADDIWINFDAGGSILIAHLTHKWQPANANAVLGRVVAGEALGTVNPPGHPTGNGNYAHIHIHVYTEKGLGGPNRPFADAYGTRFQCAIDMPDKGGTNQYSGTALTRCDNTPQPTPAYKGQFAGQEYSSTMDAGSTQTVKVSLTNTGTATWDNNTYITPVPRDTASPFYDPATWQSSTRIMSAGSVAPGQTKVFQFSLKAPSTPGTYRIPFGFVQEEVTWFGEPADGSIWFEINVIPSYKGEFAGQRYNVKMEAGSTQTVEVSLKNTGAATWDNNTKIAPVLPRETASPFYDPATWQTATRITHAGSVAPGQTKVFQFDLRAPTSPGTYKIHFGFLQEDVTWFAEPADGHIWFEIVVTHAVGEGSSRQQLFRDAYNRNGEVTQLGYPTTAAHWSSSGNAVIQAFDKDAFILHDELRDVPMNSVPAYALRGPILRHFQSLDGSRSWLGPAPTSDQFTNSSGRQQSNFPNGNITWDGTTAQATAWPVAIDGQWRAEYHNGFNLDAGPTWVQNEVAINHNWGASSPGNGARGIWADDFAVRWKGRFNFEGGDYTFVANGDDTIRVWVDGNLIINTTLAESRANRFMTPGLHDIKVEYIEVKGSAAISFGWQTAQMANCTVTVNSQAIYTAQRTVEMKANVSNAAYIQMSNDGGFAGATWQPYQPGISWTLSDPGARIATLVVYARFRDANGNALCGGTLIDDIIYDPLAPVASAAITDVSAPTSATAAQQMSSTIVTLEITAADQDGGSGVAEMQVSTDSSFAGTLWQPYQAKYQLTAQPGDTVYVRVRDSVGNTSSIATAAVPGSGSSQHRVFVPQIVR